MASEGQAARRRTANESIIVALGGNLAAGGGDLREGLVAALDLLPDYGVQVVRRSRFWRSAAWPNPTEPDFLNAVALVRTALDSGQTMSALHRVETRSGRERGRPNAPRTLDLDLIAYGRQVCTGPLILPHPRAADRLFVMGPLAELLPDWTHPLNGWRATDLAGRASIGLDAEPM